MRTSSGMVCVIVVYMRDMTCLHASYATQNLSTMVCACVWLCTYGLCECFVVYICKTCENLFCDGVCVLCFTTVRSMQRMRTCSAMVCVVYISVCCVHM